MVSRATLANDTVVLARNAAYIPRPVSENELPFPGANGSRTSLHDPYPVDGHDSFRLNTTFHRLSSLQGERFLPVPTPSTSRLYQEYRDLSLVG